MTPGELTVAWAEDLIPDARRRELGEIARAAADCGAPMHRALPLLTEPATYWCGVMQEMEALYARHIYRKRKSRIKRIAANL